MYKKEKNSFGRWLEVFILLLVQNCKLPCLSSGHCLPKEEVDLPISLSLQTTSSCIMSVNGRTFDHFNTITPTIIYRILDNA